MAATVNPVALREWGARKIGNQWVIHEKGGVEKVVALLNQTSNDEETAQFIAQNPKLLTQLVAASVMLKLMKRAHETGSFRNLREKAKLLTEFIAEIDSTIKDAGGPA